MTRVVTMLAAAVMILVAAGAADAAQQRETKRAYKPAERRQQEAEAQAAQDAEPAVAGTYEEELKVAKEKRDKELQDATSAETDQRTLEKKKQEIFAQYAAIVAALKDKYELAHADDAESTKPGKNKPRTRTARSKNADSDAAADDEAKPRKRNAKGRNTPNALAEAQEKLDEENTRHREKLDDLNAQLVKARSSDNQREIRRVEKAIEKENNSYNARKLILERHVVDLGGKIAPPAPPAEPAPVKPS